MIFDTWFYFFGGERGGGILMFATFLALKIKSRSFSENFDSYYRWRSWQRWLKSEVHVASSYPWKWACPWWPCCFLAEEQVVTCDNPGFSQAPTELSSILLKSLPQCSLVPLFKFLPHPSKNDAFSTKNLHNWCFLGIWNLPTTHQIPILGPFFPKMPRNL